MKIRLGFRGAAGEVILEVASPSAFIKKIGAVVEAAPESRLHILCADDGYILISDLQYILPVQS